MSDTTVAAPPPWEAPRGRDRRGASTRATSSRPGARCCAGSAAGAATRRCSCGTSTGSPCSWPRSCAPTVRRDPHALRDLAHEAALLERLAHPVVVRSFGAVPDGRFPHLVLEHLEGPTLDELLARDGALALEQVLPLALHVASALHYLAAEGVVHLDVKPSNVVMGAPAAADRPQRRAHARGGGAPCARRSAPTPTWRPSSARPTGASARRPTSAGLAATVHAALTGAAMARRRTAPPARRRGARAAPRRTPARARRRRRAPGSTRTRPPPHRARARRGARAARRRAAAAADARAPLLTLCGGWPAATPSPPARCSARSSSSPCTSGAGSSTGTTARACTRTRRGCSCDGGDLYGHIVVAQPPWQFFFGAGALAIHDSLTFLRLAVGLAQLGAGVLAAIAVWRLTENPWATAVAPALSLLTPWALREHGALTPELLAPPVLLGAALLAARPSDGAARGRAGRGRAVHQVAVRARADRDRALLGRAEEGARRRGDRASPCRPSSSPRSSASGSGTTA